MYPCNKLGIPSMPVIPAPKRAEIGRLLGPIGFHTRQVQGETVSQRYRWRVTEDPGLLCGILNTF